MKQEVGAVILSKSQYRSVDQDPKHGYAEKQPKIGRSYKVFLRQWDIPRGAKILDLASGRGEAAQYLRELFGATVVQTDLSHFPLSIQKNRSQRAVAEALRQPFADGVFHAIHFKDGLVHVEDKRALFAEAHRLLMPQGKFLIVTQWNEDCNTVFFDLAEEPDQPRKPNLVSKNFATAEEYVGMIRQVEENNMMLRYDNEPRRVLHISPPYFDTQIAELPHIAAGYGFRLNTQMPEPNIWAPPRAEPDWNHGARDVLEFIKI